MVEIGTSLIFRQKDSFTDPRHLAKFTNKKTKLKLATMNEGFKAHSKN